MKASTHRCQLKTVCFGRHGSGKQTGSKNSLHASAFLRDGEGGSVCGLLRASHSTT